MSLKIYTLELADGKYYVGKTYNVEQRYTAHLNGECLWTKIHKPIRIESVVEGDAFDEDKITKQMMAKHGIENVRGGSYILPDLSDEQYKFLSNEITMSKDLCIRCNKPGHFVKNCPAKCARCGRTGHAIEKCYAKTDVSGVAVKECTRCGRYKHTIENCYAKTNILGETIDDNDPIGFPENPSIIPIISLKFPELPPQISENNAIREEYVEELMKLPEDPGKPGNHIRIKEETEEIIKAQLAKPLPNIPNANTKNNAPCIIS